MSDPEIEKARDEVEQALEYIRDDYPRGNIEAAVCRAYIHLGGGVDDVFGDSLTGSEIDEYFEWLDSFADPSKQVNQRGYSDE